MSEGASDHGLASEHLVQQIASIRFLEDFTFSNPHYRKGSSKRELADLLVMSGETLIVFQVKSHRAQPDSKHNFERASRKIYEAFRQFRVLLEAVDDNALRSVRSARGVDVPFDLKSFKDIFLVVVLNYLDESNKPPPWHLRTVDFIDDEVPISLRGFEAEDFFFLASQFDTIPDFTTFLRVLDLIETKSPQSLALNFADLTAFVRLYPDELIALVDTGTPPAHLREGIANDLLDRAAEFENAESYTVDEILADLHTGMRNEALFDEAILIRLRFPPSSVQAYWSAASALAATTRIQRQQIALLLKRKRDFAALEGHAYGALILQTGREAVIVHSSASSRNDRARELGGLSIAFFAVHDVQEVIAIGAPPGSELCNHELTYIRREWLGENGAADGDFRYHLLFGAPQSVAEYWQHGRRME